VSDFAVCEEKLKLGLEGASDFVLSAAGLLKRENDCCLAESSF
jgi:hypothetical protein